MSREFSPKADNYETSTEIARRSGYSRDYISKLARAGKVRATKVGRTWLVDSVSFQSFVMSARTQRQAGLAPTLVQATPSSLPARPIAAKHAWLQTTAVVLCGCVLGMIGWFGYRSALGIDDLQQGAVAVVMDWKTQLMPPDLHTSVAATRSLPALLVGAVSQATK